MCMYELILSLLWDLRRFYASYATIRQHDLMKLKCYYYQGIHASNLEKLHVKYQCYNHFTIYSHHSTQIEHFLSMLSYHHIYLYFPCISWAFSLTLWLVINIVCYLSSCTPFAFHLTILFSGHISILYLFFSFFSNYIFIIRALFVYIYHQ